MIMNMCLINMCSKPSIAQVQYGKNKEDDKLPQLNLLLVFGEESGLPFYYRKLTGNIPESKTVKHLFEDLDILGFIDHNITVNIIKDEKIVEKRALQLPKEIHNVISCSNPRCITSIEQELEQIFYLTDPDKEIYRCKYCEEKYSRK